MRDHWRVMTLAERVALVALTLSQLAAAIVWFMAGQSSTGRLIATAVFFVLLICTLRLERRSARRLPPRTR